MLCTILKESALHHRIYCVSAILRLVRQHSEFGENGVKSGSQLTLNRLFSMIFVMPDFENECQIILMISDHGHS